MLPYFDPPVSKMRTSENEPAAGGTEKIEEGEPTAELLAKFARNIARISWGCC